MIDEQRRARILALSPEDRAALAALIRRQLDQIPGQMAKLREDEQALTGWLAEFAPEMLPQGGIGPGGRRCIASKHIPTTGATCSVCGAPGMQHEDDHPGGAR